MTLKELIRELKKHSSDARDDAVVLFDGDEPEYPYDLFEVKYNSSDGTVRLR